MVSIHCKTCNVLLGDESLFAFYQQSAAAYHLIIKAEKRNAALNVISTKEPEKAKEKKFKSADLFCKNQPSCTNKFGGDLFIGPKGESVFCFKGTSIYFVNKTNGERFDFSNSVKWSEEMKKFTVIEFKTIENFYLNVAKKFKEEKREFIETVLCNEQDISNLNISSLVSDKPRNYQVEIYANALVNNLICYVPTGGGKTMVAAMLAVAMNKFNPNKKIYFVCDRIPLVFQQASYLRYQTGLSVGEFCGQNKEISASKWDFDVLVFTADFLLNKLFSKTLFLEDCSCLIIDEIHHALQGNHSFKRLIETYYKNISDKKFKPRLLGLSASPSSGKSEMEIKDHLEELSNLVEGFVYMPKLYSEDLKQIVNRPHLNIIETENDRNSDEFVAVLNEFIQPLLANLNIFNVKLENKPHSIAYLKNIIRNIQKEINIQLNHKRFTVVKLLEKIVHSIEIMSIIGIESAVKYINELIQEDTKNMKKSRVFNLSNLISVNDFQRRIESIRGSVSSKTNTLLEILKSDINSNENSRVIVFVRTRKTARLLTDLVQKDNFIKNNWNPKIFVGHAQGSYEGMDWFEDQEPTITSFRNGECKLLISTNVLAEGLDVPVCDKIILFDRMWTLTEYVQSRGRARHVTSQFIVIGSPGEKEFFNSLMHSETLSAIIIQQMMQMQQHRFFAKELLQSMNNTIEKTFTVKERKQLSFKKIKFSLQIFINTSDEHLTKLLSKLRTCEGYSQYQLISDSYMAQELFDQKKAVNALFELRKNVSPIDELNIKLQTIKYLIKENERCAISLIEAAAKSQDTPTNLHVTCEDFTFGNLATPYEFCTNDTITGFYSANSKFIIEYNEKCIQIMFFSASTLHKIEIAFDSIDQIVCIDSEREFFNLYVPVRRAPISFFSTDEFANISNLHNIDEKFVNWERTFFENVAMWTIKLKFNSKIIFQILDAFQHIKSSTIIFTQVSNKHAFYQLNQARQEFSKTDFDSKYALECFLSQNEHFLNGKLTRDFIAALNQLETNSVLTVLERMSLYLCKYRYRNILPHFGELISNSQNEFNLKSDDSNIVITRRVTITPTRFIYHYPQLDISNSVTRAYGIENFLRIRFLDENFKKLNSSTNYSSMEKIFERIRVILNNGLMVCDRRYDFLAMSTSQLREHGCWMVFSPLNANVIRKWMGDFSKIRCIGKYVARLGQSLSNSFETFESEVYRMEPDITVPYYDEETKSIAEYCFTDGIGKISKEKAVEIAKNYFNIDYASAFQIRYAGFKGVLAVDPQLSDDNMLVFRESMMKFDSNNRKLNVINVAKYIPCFLNRQIILILSALGIPDATFNHFHDLMLKQLTGILVDDKLAVEYLNVYYRSKFAVACSEPKFKYTLEPFFKDILKEISSKFLVDLVNKSRIFIEKGRILMGTIDETGSLKSDEVFIQCSSIIKDSKIVKKSKAEENLEKYFVVTGKVTVAKNPCMHAGDLRIMNAVDKPELRHMVDCIVFPAVGHRPITNMCSGSDLDGDLYHVIWEPLLIPKIMEEPLSYNSGKAQTKDSDITIEDVISFFVQFIEIDQLGRLANTHLALSDSSAMGIKDPICIALAKAFSQAVDFPKTGYMPSMPNGIKNITYPDFMQKPSKGYESQKIIGKLYRKARSINVCNENSSRAQIDLSKCFLIDGHQAYLREATELYIAYRNEIERMMVYFECHKECELFMGIGNFRSDSHNSNNNIELSAIAINKLWKFYREIFFKPFNLSPNGCIFKNKEVLKKASAWYHACYSHPLNKRLRIISFPWIVEDALQSLPKIDVFDAFSQSVMLKYNQYRDDKQLISLFIENLMLKDDISKMIGSELMLCGSFGLFLFGDEIEANLNFLLCEPDEQSIDELKERLDDCLDNVSIFNNKLICQLNEDVTFTISSSKSSLLRFLYIRKALFDNAHLLPFFYIIIHFARIDGIFTFLSQEKVTLDLFLEFCLNFCIENNIFSVNNYDASYFEEQLRLLKCDIEQIDCQMRWNELQDQLHEYTNNQFHEGVGKKVLNFMREMAFSSNRYSFESKIDNTKIELSNKSIEMLSIHFLKAFNLLSQTAHINEVWYAMNDKPEAAFKKSFKMIKKKGKSKMVFAKNASLLLVSNYESDFDVVEFAIYNGKRRSLHLNKQCYSISSISQQKNGLSKSCENDLKMHSLAQLYKAKETQSNYTFSFQLKFGDVYFTNLPSVLLEETSSIQLYKLKEALKRGYKNYNFCFHKDREENNRIDVNDGHEPSDNDEDNDDDDDIMQPMSTSTNNFNDEDEPMNEKKKKKKKRKKIIINNANTSFDSNINTDPRVLHNLFQKNEFDGKSSDAYIVYLELLNAADNRINAFRVKYGVEMEFLQIETLPIKWLCVDICNMDASVANVKKRDIRFSLLAGKEIDLSRESLANIGSNVINRISLNDKIKEGVVRKVSEDFSDNYLAVCEDFRNCGNIFVRHTKSIKYVGNYENWKPIFDMVGITVEPSLAEKWLSKIKVSVHEVDEFSDNNEQGFFQVLGKRNELIVTLQHDINSLNMSESNEVINIMWYLSKVFALILE